MSRSNYKFSMNFNRVLATEALYQQKQEDNSTNKCNLF